MHNINLILFHMINGVAGQQHYLDRSILFLTSYVAYGVCIGVGMYWIFFRPVQGNGAIQKKRFHAQAIEFSLSMFVTWLMVKSIKLLAAFPRPFVTLTDIHVLSPNESGYSFPSGHAAITAALATALFYYNKRLGVVLYLFSFVVGMSRIYVGVHYPFDVVAGWLLGILIPLTVHTIISQKKSL